MLPKEGWLPHKPVTEGTGLEAAVAEYALAVRRRYEAAGRADKGRLLDEFCETTGMHRKAAIRLLNGKMRIPTQQRAREGGRGDTGRR